MVAQVWIQAIRPKTLPASLASVIVGAALSRSQPAFDYSVLSIILFTALGLQIVSNLANDLYDFKRGADTADRQGPTRVTQAGLLSVESMELGLLFSVVMVSAAGLYLVWHGGLPIFLLGIAALCCAIFYTAGPLPLAYIGLGDLFVFIFFGPVAVTGSAYLLGSSVTLQTLLLGCCMGSLSGAILAVNNYRDFESDRRVGKNTLAVLFGRTAVLLEYRALLCVAFLIPALLAALQLIPVSCLNILIRLTHAFALISNLHPEQSPEQLNS